MKKEIEAAEKKQIPIYFYRENRRDSISAHIGNRREKMRCRYEETRFRNENDGYCVLCYSTEDPEVPEGARNKYRGEDRFIFTAVGTELPAKKDQEVELNGRWVKV